MREVFEYSKRNIRFLCGGVVVKNIIELFYTNGLSLIETGFALLCHKSTDNLKKSFAMPMLVYSYISFICMTIALIFMSPQQVAYEVNEGAISNSTTVITYNNIPLQNYILLYWCLYAIIVCNVQSYVHTLEEYLQESDLLETRIMELPAGITKSGKGFNGKAITGTV